MIITKLGHCALVLEVKGKKFLTDPGSFTVDAQNAVMGLSAVLITHEHQDHFHVDSLKIILANNPNAVVVANAAVAKLIAEAGINATIQTVEDGGSTQVDGILIEGFGRDHAPIFETMGLVENTGYFVDNTMYFPGDNFHAPGKPADVLALPVAGPWMKMSDAIYFTQKVKPRVAFGVHDAMIQPFFRGFIGNALKMFAPDTQYVALNDGESKEF